MRKRTFRQVVTEALALLWQDIKDAKWVMIVIIAYFAFLKNYLPGLCPIAAITGFPCPACGLTRAAFLVIHFDFAGAWRMHPFIYLVIGMAILFCVNRYIFMGKKQRIVKWAAVMLLAAMVGFYIWRMAVFFPGVAPMNYYH